MPSVLSIFLAVHPVFLLQGALNVCIWLFTAHHITADAIYRWWNKNNKNSCYMKVPMYLQTSPCNERFRFSYFFQYILHFLQYIPWQNKLLSGIELIDWCLHCNKYKFNNKQTTTNEWINQWILEMDKRWTVNEGGENSILHLHTSVLGIQEKSTSKNSFNSNFKFSCRVGG